MLELAQPPKDPEPVKGPPREPVEPPARREPTPLPDPAPIDDPRPPKPRELMGPRHELTIMRLLRLEEIREAARRMRLAHATARWAAERGVPL